MGKEKKNKRFSPFARLLGLSCSFLLIGCIIYIISVGISFVSGFLLAASVTGLAGPAVASGDGFFDILSGILEMLIEGVQTIFEAIIDIISSIFG